MYVGRIHLHVEGIATYYSNENCQTCSKPVCLIVVLPSVGRNLRRQNLNNDVGSMTQVESLVTIMIGRSPQVRHKLITS